MPQIKDLIFTRTTSSDNDWLVLQDSENNQTYKIKKSDFLAGLSGGGNGGSSSIPGYALVLHFDGENNSTNFADSSTNNRDATPNGNAKIITADFKLGNGCGSFDGNSYLGIPYSSDFDFGSGDFTIEFFLKLNTYSNYGCALGIWHGFGGTVLSMWGIHQQSTSGKLRFAYWNLNGQEIILMTNTVLQLGAWYHIAITRQSGLFRLFVGGILEASLQNSDFIRNTNTRLTIAAANNGTDLSNQKMDELIIKKGEALYTANFTPRTLALQ